MFPKPKTTRDKKYLKWIRTQRCCVSGDTPEQAEEKDLEIHAHHPNSGGMGMKCSDLEAVPMRSDCHAEYHLKGKKTFQHKYNINFEEIIRELNERWTS